MKNLLTQWELRRKTDPKLETRWLSFAEVVLLGLAVLRRSHHRASTLTKLDDILKVVARHLASTLTNTDDEAENLTVHRQACIYGSGSLSPISYSGSQGSPTMPSRSQDSPTLLSSHLGLKAVQPCRSLGLKTVQPCRVLIWVSRQSNSAE